MNMPTLVIRDVPESVVEALDVRASLAGQSRETWVRNYLAEVAHQPEVKEVYRLQVSRRIKVADGGGLVVMGPQDQDGYILHETSGYIERDPTASDGTRFFLFNPLPDEYDAFKQAIEYVRRNAPGDRERAITTLGRSFDVVIETPPMAPPIGMTHKEAEMLLGEITAEIADIPGGWRVQQGVLEEIREMSSPQAGGGKAPLEFRVRLLNHLGLPHDIHSRQEWQTFKTHQMSQGS
jgi:hypothetical protein